MDINIYCRYPRDCGSLFVFCLLATVLFVLYLQILLTAFSYLSPGSILIES